jgi:16S rRNA (cytidine1402-2'-O)-methyltransferase
MRLAYGVPERAGCVANRSYLLIYLNADSKRLNQGTLFVVATPIGNLDDLSPRARQVLSDADLIAAEDTRHTGRLLSHFGIKSRQISLHDHNEEVALVNIISDLKDGKSVALVSDAGTPLISDPGFRLLRAAHDEGIRVSPIPGPSAVIAALSACGLPVDEFCFTGFLPGKKVARQKQLQTLADESRTIVFYESVHRVAETTNDLVDAFGGDRQIFVGRELTKLHEQCARTDLQSAAAMLVDGRIPLRGEFVLIVEGCSAATGPLVEISTDHLLQVLTEALPGRQAVAIAASLSGQGKNDLYRQMLALNADKNPED